MSTNIEPLKIASRAQWIATRKALLSCSLICALVITEVPLSGFAQEQFRSSDAGVHRDGQHDFDFKVGTWKSRIKRLEHPPTGPSTWVELDDTVVAQRIWDGRALLEEVEAAGGAAGHFQSLALFLYSPAAR